VSLVCSGWPCGHLEDPQSTRETEAAAAEDLQKRLLEQGTHDPSLPKPGTIVTADYREKHESDATWSSLAAGQPLRVVQWNIERGIEFDAILAELRQLQADVILLQEVDHGCDRSKGLDVGAPLKCSTQLQLVAPAMRALQPCMLPLAAGQCPRNGPRLSQPVGRKHAAVSSKRVMQLPTGRSQSVVSRDTLSAYR
jgi:hypothetical protein